MIKLGKATPNQIRYACMKYHYAKAIPSTQIAFSCYEDDEFIGVICYGGGANNNLPKSYNLVPGQVFELVRVALNGKQKSPTSKFVSISMKLLKKQKPLCKLLISYADKTNQNHKGTIYYATNWLYDGLSVSGKDAHYKVGDKLVHGRSMRAKFGNDKTRWPSFEEVSGLEKHRFIYPMDKKWYDEYMRQQSKSKTATFQ